MTVRSYGTPVIPSGVLVAESEREADGYIIYEKTALQGAITGVKQTYKDVIEVTDAGKVTCTSTNASAGEIGGSVAIAQVSPPTQVQLAATVTIEIDTSPPNTATLAYNLEGISCSVTTISMSENFRGSDQFETKSGNTRFSGKRKAADMSARISTYPSCFLGSSRSSGSFTYVSSYENNSKNTRTLAPNPQISTTTTQCIGSGSTQKNYSKKGIIKRESRPVLTDLNGVTYYEIITWEV